LLLVVQLEVVVQLTDLLLFNYRMWVSGQRWTYAVTA
jgi:hypothetical protein